MSMRVKTQSAVGAGRVDLSDRVAGPIAFSFARRASAKRCFSAAGLRLRDSVLAEPEERRSRHLRAFQSAALLPCDSSPRLEWHALTLACPHCSSFHSASVFLDRRRGTVMWTGTHVGAVPSQTPAVNSPAGRACRRMPDFAAAPRSRACRRILPRYRL